MAILWLVSAVIIHLPTPATLGIDVRADVGLGLTVFVLSVAVLGVAHAAHAAAVLTGVVAPVLLLPESARAAATGGPSSNGSKRLWWPIVLINSASLGIACSTYYAFCGNAGQQQQAQASANAGGTVHGPLPLPPPDVRSSVCGWLAPLSASAFSSYAAWVLYGGASGVSLTSTPSPFPTISPVFTLWLTGVCMYAAHALADYAAAVTIGDGGGRAAAAAAAAAAHDPRARQACSLQVDGLLSSTFENAWPAFAGEQGLKSKPNLLSMSAKVSLIASAGVGAWGGWRAGDGSESVQSVEGAALVADATAGAAALAADAELAADKATGYATSPEGVKGPVVVATMKTSAAPTNLLSAGPDFLPMVPWYAGTSADFYRMLFGHLAVSLKFFAGRFDLRAEHAAALDAAASAAGGRKIDATADATSPAQCRPPAHGDGRTFEHLALRDPPPGGLWLDFMADTGDGGDSTYTVARALAAPRLTVSIPAHLAARLRLLDRAGDDMPLPAQVVPVDGPPTASSTPSETHVLPRGAALILGGDLAYPYPTRETYERRLVGPFEAALPPFEAALSRPAGAPEGVTVTASGVAWRAQSPLVPTASATAILSTALGSASNLPPRPLPPGRCAEHGGGPTAPPAPAQFTCGSCNSIANSAAWRGPAALAIPGNHDWVDGLAVYSSFILDRSWLGGWALPQAASYFALRLPAGWWLLGLDLALTGDIDPAQFRYFVRIADDRMAPGDAAILVTHEPHWLTRWFEGRDPPPHVGRLVEDHLRGRARIHLAGDIHFYMRHSFVAAETTRVAPAPSNGDGDGETRTAPPPPQWCTPAPATAPEHLVVVGTGGAFTHPTHTFTGATFRPQLLVADAKAQAVQEPSSSRRSGTPQPGTLPGRQPPPVAGVAAPASSEPLSRPLSPPRGEYVCGAAFPSAVASRKLGKANLHLFRLNNTHFDVIGGGIYFLLAVSAMPRCASTARVLEANSLAAGASAIGAAVLEYLYFIMAKSRLSVSVLALFVCLCFAFARTGGVGALTSFPPPPCPGARRSLAEAASRRVRTGGLSTQLVWAICHAAIHLMAAVILAVALDVGVAMVARSGVGLGAGGPSLYSWYRAFEAAAFPDPAGLRAALSTVTAGAYPGLLKAAMAVYDVPEAIAVGRAAVCAGKAASLTWLQGLSFYGGLLAYYWILATPVVGLLFGAYLYISCNGLGVHYDEAFSALRLPGHKGFARLRILPSGDLVLYAVGVASVPRRWTEDPRWRQPGGGGDTSRPAHEAAHPSRWAPAVAVRRRACGGALGGGAVRGAPTTAAWDSTATPGVGAEPAWEAVDVLVVPRAAPTAAAVLPELARQARAGGGDTAPPPARSPLQPPPVLAACRTVASLRATVAAGPV